MSTAVADPTVTTDPVPGSSDPDAPITAIASAESDAADQGASSSTGALEPADEGPELEEGAAQSTARRTWLDYHNDDIAALNNSSEGRTFLGTSFQCCQLEIHEGRKVRCPVSGSPADLYCDEENRPQTALMHSMNRKLLDFVQDQEDSDGKKVGKQVYCQGHRGDAENRVCAAFIEFAMKRGYAKSRAEAGDLLDRRLREWHISKFFIRLSSAVRISIDAEMSKKMRASNTVLNEDEADDFLRGRRH